MTSTLPTHPSTHAVRWIVAATAVVAVLVALLATGGTTERTAVPTEPVLPAAEDVPDRGTGDPCALRHETGGGFLEGLDVADRCRPVQGPAPVTGRIP